MYRWQEITLSRVETGTAEELPRAQSEAIWRFVNQVRVRALSPPFVGFKEHVESGGVTVCLVWRQGGRKLDAEFYPGGTCSVTRKVDAVDLTPNPAAYGSEGELIMADVRWMLWGSETPPPPKPAPPLSTE